MNQGKEITTTVIVLILPFVFLSPFIIALIQNYLVECKASFFKKLMAMIAVPVCSITFLFFFMDFFIIFFPLFIPLYLSILVLPLVSIINTLQRIYANPKQGLTLMTCLILSPIYFYSPVIIFIFTVLLGLTSAGLVMYSSLQLMIKGEKNNRLWYFSWDLLSSACLILICVFISIIFFK